MEDAANTLVIILSVFLAFFLLLACVLTFLLVKVTWQIKKITKTAQHTAESIDSVVTGAAKIATPAMVTKIVTSQFKKFINRRK